MPNTPFGPFGISDLPNLTVNQLRSIANQIETPPFINQGPLPPAYMRALNGDLNPNPITYRPINVDSDDDELLDPPAFRRAVDFSDVYRLSGINNVVDATGDAISKATSDARNNFLDWLNSGPKTRGGAIARQAGKDLARGVEFVRDGSTEGPDGFFNNLPLVGPIKRGVGSVIDWLNAPAAGTGFQIPMPGNPAEAEPNGTTIAGPSNSLPPGVTLEEALGIPPKQMASGRSMSQGDPNFDGPTAPFDFSRSDFSPVGGMGFDDSLPEGFIPPEVHPSTEAKADAAADAVKEADKKARKGDSSWSDALIALGGGMAASKQTNFAGATGEGILMGLKSLKDSKSNEFKERQLRVEERKADATMLSAGAALIKAREDKKPTKAKEFEYLHTGLGWSEEDAAKGAKFLNDLDDDLIKIVVAESARTQAMGLGELKLDDMVKIIKTAKEAKALTGSTGQTASGNGTVGRKIIRDATGKLTFSN